jgi:hypothetical protein
MKRLSIALVWTVMMFAFSPAAGAADWIFRGSYYTYSPLRGGEVGVNRFARTIDRPSFYVRSGYRNLHSRINVGRYSWDHLNIQESWVQFEAN